MTRKFKTLSKSGTILVGISEPERTDYFMIGDQKMYMDTKFDALWKIQQQGYVVGTNAYAESLGLKNGRKVWYHHFVIGEDTNKKEFESNGIKIDGVTVYSANIHEEVFAYEDEDGVFFPVLDRIFLKSITRRKTEINTSLFVPDHMANEEAKGMAEVIAFGPSCKDSGIKVGDTIAFSAYSDYRVKINGVEMICMQLEDVMAVLNPYAKLNADVIF